MSNNNPFFPQFRPSREQVRAWHETNLSWHKDALAKAARDYIGQPPKREKIFEAKKLAVFGTGYIFIYLSSEKIFDKLTPKAKNSNMIFYLNSIYPRPGCQKQPDWQPQPPRDEAEMTNKSINKRKRNHFNFQFHFPTGKKTNLLTVSNLF